MEEIVRRSADSDPHERGIVPSLLPFRFIQPIKSLGMPASVLPFTLEAAREGWQVDTQVSLPFIKSEHNFRLFSTELVQSRYMIGCEPWVQIVCWELLLSKEGLVNKYLAPPDMEDPTPRVSPNWRLLEDNFEPLLLRVTPEEKVLMTQNAILKMPEGQIIRGYQRWLELI